MVIERKGQDAYPISKVVKFIIETNNETTFIRAGDKDRRYWLRSPDEFPKEHIDPDFFRKLKDEIPAFLYFLLNTPIETKNSDRMWFDFDLIKNKVWDDVVYESRAKWMDDVEDYVDYLALNGPDIIKSNDLVEQDGSLFEDTKSSNKIYFNLNDFREYSNYKGKQGMILKYLKKKYDAKKCDNPLLIDGKQKRYWIIEDYSVYTAFTLLKP